MSDELLARLEKKIAFHEKWGPSDFSRHQVILWVAVLSSFMATILSGAEANKVVVSTIAALPALMLLVDKTFRYQERGNWHDSYAVELNNLRDELQVSKVPATDIVTRLSQLRKDKDKSWPGSGQVPQSPE